MGGREFDSWLAEQALARILDAAVGADRGDSVQVVWGEETSWPRVIDAARTPSLFVPRRAVVVRRAEALKGPEADVAPYLADPTPGVTLVLIAPKIDRRRSVWKKVLEAAEVSVAEPLKGQALKRYVADEVRRRGLKLAPEALEELIDRVGQDLRRLIGEIEKLEAFAQGRSLGAEEVAAVLGRGMAQPLYKLSDAMAERQAVTVLELAEELLEGGEDALRILGTLHRTLRQVRAARALKQARASREAMLESLGLKGNLAFKLDAVLAAARHWSEAELRFALLALDRADRRIKTGADVRLSLTAAVAEACGKGEVAWGFSGA